MDASSRGLAATSALAGLALGRARHGAHADDRLGLDDAQRWLDGERREVHRVLDHDDDRTSRNRLRVQAAEVLVDTARPDLLLHRHGLRSIPAPLRGVEKIADNDDENENHSAEPDGLNTLGGSCVYDDFIISFAA